jgi:CDP-diacylglycerol---serine O-phosphatidyltransferase
MAVLLVIGFALVPVITGCLLAYGYLLAPILVPVVAPLARLLPTRLKEALS